MPAAFDSPEPRGGGSGGAAAAVVQEEESSASSSAGNDPVDWDFLQSTTTHPHPVVDEPQAVAGEEDSGPGGAGDGVAAEAGEAALDAVIPGAGAVVKVADLFDKIMSPVPPPAEGQPQSGAPTTATAVAIRFKKKEKVEAAQAEDEGDDDEDAGTKGKGEGE